MPKIIERECLRCKAKGENGKWIPRQFGKPKVCPKCNSPFWNKPPTRWMPEERVELTEGV